MWDVGVWGENKKGGDEGIGERMCNVYIYIYFFFFKQKTAYEITR